MLLFFSRKISGELLLWGRNPLRALMLSFTYCACSACECPRVKQCPLPSLTCLFPSASSVSTVPLSPLFPAGSSTDLCAFLPQVSLYSFQDSLSSCGVRTPSAFLYCPFLCSEDAIGLIPELQVLNPWDYAPHNLGALLPFFLETLLLFLPLKARLQFSFWQYN